MADSLKQDDSLIVLWGHSAAQGIAAPAARNSGCPESSRWPDPTGLTLQIGILAEEKIGPAIGVMQSAAPNCM
jgi:hypothetical protein